MNKKLILAGVVVLILIFIFFKFASSENASQSEKPDPNTKQTPIVSEKDPPQIVSTMPNPLNESVIANVSKIEITFNRPLENEGEFKVRIEPKVEFKVTVSNERKTGVITFQKPLELGMTYTLFIGPDTKFTGLGNWGESKEFHFGTIPYRGL